MQLALGARVTMALGSLFGLLGPSGQDSSRPRPAQLLETLKEYEIVTPTRVNEFGEPFPTTVHFPRKKRSLPLDVEPWGLDSTSSFTSSSSSSSFSPTTQAHYKLTAFGQHFFFNLTAHSGFIAPLFTVSFLGEQEANQTNFYTKEQSDVKHCFYKGHVNTDPQHMAVISLCSGMLGTFRSHDGEYFIEPLISPDQQKYEEEHKKPHVVYRRSVPPTFPPEDKQTCDTSGLLLDYATLVSLFQLSLLPSLRSDAGDSEQLERNMGSGTIHQQPLEEQISGM